MFRSSGAVRKCSSMAWAPARKASNWSMPIRQATGSPIADQTE